MSGGTPPFMLRLLSASVCAANRSGAIIREVLKGGNLGTVEKGVNDPQTEADRRSQRCIAATLQHRFPGINLIGEEDDVATEESDQFLVDINEECSEIFTEACPVHISQLTLNDVVVWVDPLDGTKEFTEGFPEHVTVLIGISHKNRPVGGVIHQPFYGATGRTVWGVPGVGVRGVSHVPAGNAKDVMRDGPKIVVTRSHMSKAISETIEALKPSEILKYGGCGHKILLVMEGKADAYIHPSIGTKKWDTCAPEAILIAAGGKMTDTFGDILQYDTDPSNIMNKKGIVVTMCSHDDLVARIPQHVKDTFQ